MAEQLTYEEAISKLENIVKTLEEGDVTLEKSINLFTEGMNLVKTCNNHLEQSEQKIKVLLDGKYEDLKWSKED